MRTPTQAILWELWRTSRAELLIRIGFTTALVILISSPLFLKRLRGEPEEIVVCGIVLMMLVINSVSSSTIMLQFDKQQTGFGFRLGFVRPVSTARIVGLPMLYSIITSVLSFESMAWLFAALQNMPMPIFGPAPLIACVVACGIAASWSPRTIFVKLIAFSGMLTALVLAMRAYHVRRGDSDPFLTAIGKPEFYDFAWHQYFVIGAITFLAFVITVVCVDRQRHGDGLRIKRPGRTKQYVKTESDTIRRRFSNRFVAEFWYEYRRSGRRMLLLGLIAPLAVFAFVTVGQLIDPRAREVPPIWFFAVALCPFVYQILGVEGALGLQRRQGSLKFSSFDATVPMRNDQLIAVKLVVIAACSLVGWLCMAFAGALHTATLGDWQPWMKMGETFSRFVGTVPIYWWIAAAFTTALVYVSSSSMLLAFGFWVPLHGRILLGLTAIAYVHIGLAAWDALHHWVLRPLWIADAYLLAAAIVIGSVLILKKALSSGFLGKRLFCAALVLWGVYITSTVALYLKVNAPVEIPRAVMVLGASLLLVPLASTALAPLALALHRNR